MSSERHVKVFKNGRNQAVQIPREFEFSSEEAIMRKEGDRLIIEPAPPKSLLAVLATLTPLRDDFPPIQDLPPDPVALWCVTSATPISFLILSATRREKWHSTSARLVKRKSVPALSSLRNCVIGLPRKGHSGSRPSSRPCLVRLKSCPSRRQPMPLTDCCARGLSRLADQSAPMICSLRLRHLLLGTSSSPITTGNLPTSRTFDGRTGYTKPIVF